MTKLLMPTRTLEAVTLSSGRPVSPVQRCSGAAAPIHGTRAPFGGWVSDRDRMQQVLVGSTGAVSLLVTESAYTDLSTQLVPTDPRAAVRNGNPGLRTWSPPV